MSFKRLWNWFAKRKGKRLREEHLTHRETERELRKILQQNKDEAINAVNHLRQLGLLDEEIRLLELDTRVRFNESGPHIEVRGESASEILRRFGSAQAEGIIISIWFLRGYRGGISGLERDIAGARRKRIEKLGERRRMKGKPPYRGE